MLSLSLPWRESPGRTWPKSAKPGSVSIRFLRNSVSTPVLSAVPRLCQTPSPAVGPPLTADCVFKMGLLWGVIDKLDLAQPPRRLRSFGRIVTFLPSGGGARHSSPQLLGEETVGRPPAHTHPEVGSAPSARPPRGYLYKQHFERVCAIHPEHLQLRLVVATAALHLSSSGQWDIGLFRDQLGTQTPRTPSALPASAGAVKGSASKLGVARLSAPLLARSQVREHAVRCSTCRHGR